MLRATRTTFTTCAATLLLVSVLGQEAFAVTKYPSLGRITGPAPATAFKRLESEAVAVNAASGHIYIADSGNGRVYNFASASDPAPEVWDGSTTTDGSFGGGTVSVAVDSETGGVYVADLTHLVIDKFTASGSLIKTFGDSAPAPNGQLAGVETPAGAFAHSATPIGIAVDQASHDLFVIDSGHQVIDAFNQEGQFLPTKQITATPLGLYGCGGIFTDGVAVNAASGHVFISDGCSEEVFEFDAASNLVGEPWNGAGAPTAFAGALSPAVNNASGDIYIANSFPRSEPPVDRFTANREYTVPQLIRTPETETGALAVDQATGSLYLADSTATSSSVNIFGGKAVLLPSVSSSPASGVRAGSVTLNGSVDPEGDLVTECRFEYAEEAVYDSTAFEPYVRGKAIPCVETVGSGDGEVMVHADLTGLRADTIYHYRLDAANANGANFGGDQVFLTTPPPTITAVSASGLTSTAVDLTAQIDPHRANTSYRFEYGTDTSYGTSIPVFDEAIGSQPREVIQHLAGLAANTSYHWRVVASNEAGVATSLDHTFDYLTSGVKLPDNRAYEMITPTNKNGALVGDVFLGLGPDIARDGKRLILSSVQCFADAGSCIVNRALVGASFEFQRTPEGWHASALGPSSQQFEANAIWTVGADLGSALFSMPTPPLNEDDLYVRQPSGEFANIGPTTPPNEGPKGAVGAQSADTKAATADLSHYVYGLTTPVWPFDKSTGSTLYEYVGRHNTQPLLVAVTGGRGSHDLISVCGAHLGTGTNAVTYPDALSEGGGVVFFTATGSVGGECFGTGENKEAKVLANTLYARIGESETVRISEHSVARCGIVCQSTPPGDAEFQGASSDGSKVFFTSTQQLIDEASEDPNGSAATGCATTTSANGCNLYEYDFDRVLGDRLTALSAGGGVVGPRVQGVMAISDDGSHAYFVAKGVLTATPNAQGQTAEDGGNNLYVATGSSVKFIATLSPTEEGEWKEGALFANVSPDGRMLVFESAGRLTGDTGGSGVLQVFRYDAGTGQLLRLSRGIKGFNDDGNSPADRECKEMQSCPEGASVVRAGAFYSFAGAWRRDPSMSDDGSYVFFQSPVGLVPGALNDVRVGETGAGEPIFAENVYEWHDGSVSLISDGKDVSVVPTALCGLSSAVCLAGASVSGRDVFFTTTEKMVTQDTDTQLDFYDARICGSSDPCVAASTGSVAACDGEACRGIPAGTPSAPAALSMSFNGAENPPLSKRIAPKRCHKHFVKRHGKCVKGKAKRKPKAGRRRHARARG